MKKTPTDIETAKNTTLLDVTQAAADWAERRVFCVPLQQGTKRPKQNRWQHLRLVDDDFSTAFKPGDNLGGIWGEPSDWAVDLDLDLETAPLVAKHFLKEYETFIYGRREKRYSHYVFRCVGAVTLKKFVSAKRDDPNDPGMVVEIRSTGAQSVLPPSKHPDGDRYFIEHDTEFFNISRFELERLANDIAIAAVFLHFYPMGKHSGRHDYVHACTGALCHAKWKPVRIKRVMAAVLSEVVGEDEEMRDRMGAVVSTLDSYKNGGQVRGLTTLEDFTTKTTVQRLRQWLSTKNDVLEHLSVEDDPGLVKPSKRKLRLDFKKEWLEVPGLISDVAAWAHKMSYIQQPIFDLAAGLMCTSLASCNQYIVDVWDTPLSPYIMLTAPTGAGKESSMRAIKEFAQAIGLNDTVYDGFQSYYAMLDTLGEEGRVLLTWDEAARNLIAAKNIQGPDFQTITHIIKLYGAGNKIVSAVPGRKTTIPELIHPFVTVLATAQPDMLLEALDKNAEDTGFVNRFLLFDTLDEMPPLNRSRSTVFPSTLKRQGMLLRNHEIAPGQEFTRIGFSPAKTYNMFRDFEEVQRRRVGEKKEKTWARATQNALILGGLGALSADPFRPMITADLANWAIEIVTWSSDCWTERLKAAAGGERNAKESHSVQTIICNPSNYTKYARTSTQYRQLKKLNEGYMPHSVLVRATRGLSPRRRQEILDDLHESDLIASVETDGGLYYYEKL